MVLQRSRSDLDLQPKFTIEDGVEELINAFSYGIFSDSLQHKENYGNYEVNY